MIIREFIASLGFFLHAELGDTVCLHADILRHRDANRARARDKQSSEPQSAWGKHKNAMRAATILETDRPRSCLSMLPSCTMSRIGALAARQHSQSLREREGGSRWRPQEASWSQQKKAEEKTEQNKHKLDRTYAQTGPCAFGPQNSVRPPCAMQASPISRQSQWQEWRVRSPDGPFLPRNLTGVSASCIARRGEVDAWGPKSCGRLWGSNRLKSQDLAAHCLDCASRQILPGTFLGASA